MTSTLDVYLHSNLTGHLIQDEHGQTLFEYTPDWLKNPDAVIFNFLIGNHDAHGKNFSLLYRTQDNSGSFGKIRLAPLYDLICTPVYSNLSKKMAMKIGKAYELSEVDPRQFEKLADEIGFTKPLVKRKVIDNAKKMLQQIDKVQIPYPVTDEIRKFIGDHCSNVLDRFITDESKKQAAIQ